MEERKLLVPQVYKHFKDKLYCTMGVSMPVQSCRGKHIQWCGIKILYVQHTEKEEPVGIILDKKSGNCFHFEQDEADELVLYRSLYDSTGIYARPKKMFLSPVDKDKYPNAKQYWRMEEYNDKEEF